MANEMDGSHDPANSTEAISHLEALRAKGGEYLLIPKTALRWLDHYGEFRQHLEKCYKPVVRQEDTCIIFALDPRATEQKGQVLQEDNARKTAAA